MTIRANIKEDRRQVSFYPKIELINKIDALVESEDGKNSRAYILECIIEDWFSKQEQQKEI